VVRKLDRYLFFSFLIPFVLCMVLIISMVIAMETSERLGKLLKYKGEEPLIGLLVRYYAYRIPVLAVMVAPIITLSGAIVALVRLARQNELMAMQASGISLKRIAMPLLAGGFLAAALALWVQEGLVPASARKMQRITIKLLGSGKKDPNIYNNLFAAHSQSAGGVSMWMCVAELDYRTKTMRDAYVYHPDGGYPLRIDKAVWSGGRWTGSGERTLTTDAGLQPEPFIDLQLDLPITPEDLTERGAIDLPYRSIGELRRLARQIPSRSLQLNAEIHRRLASPFINVLLLLLAVPLVVEPGGQTSIRGIGLAVGVTIAFYVVMWAMHDLGTRGFMAPFAAAWLPMAIFTVIGLWMYHRSHV